MRTIKIEELNVKIEITENKTEECFDYLISNIKKVANEFKSFHVSYAFYADTERKAILAALKDLAEKYEEFIDNSL